MAQQYRITDPISGRSLIVSGPSKPPASVQRQLFAQLEKQSPKPAGKPSMVDRAVEALPMIGGAVGGALGAATGIPTLGLSSVPAGIVGATVLGAGGEAIKQNINRLRGAEAPATAGEAAGDIALEGVGQGAMEAAGVGAMKGLGAAGTAVYRGYLKPSLAAKNLGTANEIVETALREWLPITRGGAAKADRLTSELKREVDDVLAKSGKTVDLVEIADRVRAFARRKYYRPGADLSDYDAVMAVADRIDKHPSLRIPAGSMPPSIDIPVAAGNETKRALQESARSSYGVPGAAATAQGEKKAAALARQTLERELGGPGGKYAVNNARESKLIDAAKAIKRAVEREANQQALYGAKSLVAAGTAGAGTYATTGDMATTAAVALGTRFALTPAVMSRAAMIAYHLGRIPGTAPATAARIAILTALEPEDTEP